MPTPKEAFLADYDKEHAKTLRVLRAMPPDQVGFKPSGNCRTAGEIAWTFVLERGLGTAVMKNELAGGVPPGRKPPPAPERWEDIVAAVEKAHFDFGAFVRGMSDAELEQTVRFFVGPKTMGDWKRIDFLRFLLHDEIHHRGQLSVYLRAAGAKVPAIYGPSGDEPWT
jgi:uncharacterized damage-inducible protein DinB